jgi:hypothetical protein
LTASNLLIQPSDIHFTCLPHNSDHRKIYRRFHFEKIRARDRWHLTSRIARKVLAHTLGIFVNRLLGRSDLQFEGLIA